MQWYWWVIIVVVVLLLICFAVGFVCWNMSIPTPSKEKLDNPKPSSDPVETEMREFTEKVVANLKSLNMEDVWIKSEDGLNLHGYLKMAATKTNKTIISVHGWHGSGLSTSSIFSHFLVDYNYNVLFIDLRSYGESEGKYTTYGVKDSMDLMSWIKYLVDRFNGDISIALFGISMGGNTVAVVADRVPKQVKCIIDDCGFTTAREEFKYVLKYNMHVPTFFLFFAEIINRMVCHFGFNDEDSRKSLKSSKVPVFFIHGTTDTFVPTYMGKENYEACTSEKEIQYFDNGHARNYFMQKEAYKKLVLDFLAKHL